MALLVRKSNGWAAVEPVSYQAEGEFQALVQETFEDTLASQGDRPAIIAREVSTPVGGRIDVVAADQDGVITLCECKLDRNAGSRREVLGQVIEYAASLNGMTFDDFRRLMSDRLGADPVDAMRERAGDDFDPGAWQQAISRTLADGRFRLVIAVDQLTEVLKQTVLYLNERASFSLVVAELQRIKHDGVDVLAPSLFGEEAARRKFPRRSTASPTVRDADTVVVAATIAYPEYQRFGAYICQPKRSFRDAQFLGFYTDRTIFPEFPKIVHRHPDLLFTPEEADRLCRGDEWGQKVAKVMEAVLADSSSNRHGEREQVVLLEIAQGFTLERAIRHDGPGAWTQGQRYASSKALRMNPATTDELATAEG